MVSCILGFWTLCCWSWPWTPDAHVPISKILGLQACANIKIFFIKKTLGGIFESQRTYSYITCIKYTFFLLILEIFLDSKDKRKTYQMIPQEMEKFTYKRKHIWAKYCSCLKGGEKALPAKQRCRQRMVHKLQVLLKRAFWPNTKPTQPWCWDNCW